jgi:hypothetical protein
MDNSGVTRYVCLMTAAQRLARRIAEHAVELANGRRTRLPERELTPLLEQLGRDERGVEGFFEALAHELRARGVPMPPLDELPDSVAPLVAAADGAFDLGPDGQPDLEASLERMESALHHSLGTSPRQQLRDQLRDRIRREVSASVASSLRKDGITPARDMPDDPDDE